MADIKAKIRDAVRSMPSPIEEKDRRNYNITDVVKGGFIQFMGQLWKVESFSRYQGWNWKFKKQKKWQFFELELFSLKDGKTIYLEWEEDDEVEVTLTLDKYKFRELLDEDGNRLNKSIFKSIVEDEAGIALDGEIYWYDDNESSACEYFHDGSIEGERVRFYEFKSDNGKFLTVEEWFDDEDREFEVYSSKSISLGDIEVMVTGK